MLNHPLFKNMLRKLFLLTIIIVFFMQSALLAEGGRTPVKARKAMVVSTSRYATEAGLDVLKNGGNAIDAAVATAFALAVTWPAAGNIGGGGFLVYHSADGEITCFDFREKAPLAASKTMYLDSIGQIINRSNHEGLLAVGVPGSVAGLALAHERLGSKKWKSLVEPAYKLAKDGIELTWGLADGFAYFQNQWEKFPSSAKKFLNEHGEPLQAGTKWKQKDLAATLKRIMNDGADGFYKGKTARLIVEFMRKNGGIITEEDLAAYQPVERTPIHGTFRGYDVYAMYPPSSGAIVLVEMLNILESFDLNKMGHNSAEYLHVLTEAMRRAYADRARFLGDPDFNSDMPIDRLISKTYADSLRATISLEHASTSDSSNFNEAYESPETTHFSIIDAAGNMVSMTTTLEQSFGCKMVVEGAGFLLNNEMGDFNPMPGVTDTRGYIGTPPNQIAPEKRMLSSMTPTILAKDGKPVMAIGSPGGRRIIATVMQVILNKIVHEMNIAEAIEAPRMYHQWLPDFSRFERMGFSKDTRERYLQYGHTIRDYGYQGRAMGIWLDIETGFIYGAADSRSPDGVALGF